MQPTNKALGFQASSGDLPKRIPEIALRHGQALWLLTELGFRGDVAPPTFYEYIKSLRKLGIPFEAGEIGMARRNLANYSYCHLMELALALTLRVYNVVPDSVLVGIIRYRKSLRIHYRRAYAERCSGRGAPVVFETEGWPPIHLRGVFLDLQLESSGGRLTKLGPPRTLSPYEAVSSFTERDLTTPTLLPIGLSLLAERLVALSFRVPSIRRGPRQSTTGPSHWGAEVASTPKHG